MIGLARQRGDSPLLRWGNITRIDFVTIRRQHDLFLLRGRDLFPQGLRALAATSSYGEHQHVARLGTKGLILHQTRLFVKLFSGS